ncbi:hsp70-binding protein 1-like [Passerculus sandwichensis]
MSQALSGPGSSRAELQRCLRLLAGPCPGEAAPERGLGDTGGHEGALEELCDLCESLDNANEFCSLGGLEVVLDLLGHRWPPLQFCSLGGLEVVLDLLGHRWPPLRAGAARLLGSCAQNLPEAQGRALALGALPAPAGGAAGGPRPAGGPLRRSSPCPGDPDPQVAPTALFAVSCESGGNWGVLGGFGGPRPAVAPAALFAVSCLVRAQPEGLQQLEALGGLEVLGGALQSPPPPLRARAPFLLHCLLREHPRLTAPLVQQGLVPRAAALLRSEHDGAHEHGLGVLCSLASGCPEGLRECRDPALGLEELLRERRELLRGPRRVPGGAGILRAAAAALLRDPPRRIHHGPMTQNPPKFPQKSPNAANPRAGGE